MIDLDQVIDQSYREASDVEASSRRLEARIEQIPGAKGLLPSRKYGTPVNFKAIQGNLTLASLISRSDAALAHYCGLYFNENGSDKGFGDGGIIAILKGAPELTSDNLEFV